VLAAGGLAEARMPDIEGIDSFAGPIMHTARWDESVGLAGKRVGVIGTGASAIQTVPRSLPWSQASRSSSARRRGYCLTSATR